MFVKFHNQYGLGQKVGLFWVVGATDLLGDFIINGYPFTVKSISWAAPGPCWLVYRYITPLKNQDSHDWEPHHTSISLHDV